MRLPRCSPEEAMEMWRAIVITAHNHGGPDACSQAEVDAANQIREALAPLDNGKRAILLDMFLLDMVAGAEESGAIHRVQ